MILGIGNDIIEVKRIKGILQRYKSRFLDRVFTSDEQLYCESKKEPSIHYAARFAAKEAIVKALGVGFSEGLSWLDIEIRKNEMGKPFVVFSSKINSKFHSPHVQISLSHCHSYATAVAIWSQ